MRPALPAEFSVGMALHGIFCDECCQMTMVPVDEPLPDSCCVCGADAPAPLGFCGSTVTAVDVENGIVTVDSKA